MAEYGGAAHNHRQPGQPANIFPGPDPERRNQRLSLDAGRALLLCGALVTTTTAFGFGPANANANSPAANTIAAFVGFRPRLRGP
jgi:hypothetical protein